MTREQPPDSAIDSGESSDTVQLLVADAGNRSAIGGMLEERFDVVTSRTLTNADLYLIEDHLFSEYRAELREQIEREHPAFCPVVLIRRERTDLRQGDVDPSGPDEAVRYDEVIDAPIDPPQLIRRLNSLLVRRQQSRELMQQVSTLEKREQRLRRFEHGVEATGNGIVMTSPTGTIEYVNPALESIAGYTEDDALGESPQILRPEGSGEIFNEEFWRTMTDQGEWKGDIVIERKDSQRRVVSATVTTLHDADSETDGFVIVLSDITGRIQREQELEDREKELDLLRQILTRYLRHNLRNDLNVIQGNAQLLAEDETLSPKQIELAETIIESSGKLIEKSETARAYSTLLEREEALSLFDLSEITTNVVRNVREAYPDVDFEIDVPETCEIWAREGIKRAVEELIDNAARHNDSTDPWVRIQVRDHEVPRLMIEDNGPGIPVQERDSLERGTETQLSHSQGMGLWLSKLVIDGLDGVLSIDPTDSGTVVGVDFSTPESAGFEAVEVTTLKERERRLQTITDRMTDATLEVDAGWKITRLGKRAERILELNVDVVIGNSLWDVFSDLHDTRFETVVRNAMKSRSSASVEEYFAEIGAWMEVNVYPEFDGGLSFYIRDVTERIEREEALQETKQRLETIIELSPAAVVAVDSSGTVFLWNEAAEDVFGHPTADVIGERLQSLDLFDEGRSSRFKQRFEQVLSGETIRGLEIERQRNDGTTVDLSISAAPLHDASEAETGMIAVAQDISKLKERERDLLDAIEDVVYVLDSDGDFRDWNAALEDVTGYTGEELESMNALDLFKKEDADAVAASLEESSETGRTRVELDFLTAGGEVIPYEFIANAFEGPDGDPVVAGIGRDRSGHLEYEQKLQEQRDNLEILNQVVRHDIRNDMNVVEGRADLLEEHVEEAGKPDLEAVQKSTESAIELTETARDLSETMLSTKEDIESVRLDRYLAPPMENARSKFDNAVITIEDGIPSVRVRGNDMLEAVFRNLIQNAIIHNDKEAPQVHITISATEEILTVTVTDNGPGIPDEKKEMVFGKGGKGLDSPGTGLGLYLVESLVEQYGGHVRVEDADPEGSVFSVELPIAGETETNPCS